MTWQTDGDPDLGRRHTTFPPPDAFRQPGDAIVGSDAERIGCELVAFARRGDVISVVTWGMWRGPQPLFAVYEQGSVLDLTVTGVDDAGPARPFVLALEHDVEGLSSVRVRGVRTDERIDIETLAETPVVCGADPWLAGLGGPFRHRRGDRIVDIDGAERAAIPSPRTAVHRPGVR